MGCFLRSRAECDVQIRVFALKALHSYGIMRLYLDSPPDQMARDIQCWSIPQIVRVGLERQPENPNRAPLENLKLAQELRDHGSALAKIYLARRLHDRHIQRIVARRRDQSRRVLAETRSAPADPRLQESSSD